MAEITLERELGSAAEQLLAKLLECGETSPFTLTALIYSALVDIYILGAQHKNFDGQLPRVKESGWHHATLFVHPPAIDPIEFAQLLSLPLDTREILLRGDLTGTPEAGKAGE